MRSLYWPLCSYCALCCAIRNVAPNCSSLLLISPKNEFETFLSFWLIRPFAVRSVTLVFGDSLVLIVKRKQPVDQRKLRRRIRRLALFCWRELNIVKRDGAYSRWKNSCRLAFCVSAGFKT